MANASTASFGPVSSFPDPLALGVACVSESDDGTRRARVNSRLLTLLEREALALRIRMGLPHLLPQIASGNVTLHLIHARRAPLILGAFGARDATCPITTLRHVRSSVSSHLPQNSRLQSFTVARRRYRTGNTAPDPLPLTGFSSESRSRRDLWSGERDRDRGFFWKAHIEVSQARTGTLCVYLASRAA